MSHNEAMKGAYKEYDPKLHDASKISEEIIEPHLEDIGYKITHHPDGRYLVDTSARSDAEHFFIDVRCPEFSFWPAGTPWPYKTVNVEERKGLPGKLPPNTKIFVVRRDLQSAIVIQSKSWRDLELVPMPNKKKAGELCYPVPIEECLPIDLTDKTKITLDEQNAIRCRAGHDNQGVCPRPPAGGEHSLAFMERWVRMLGTRHVAPGLTRREWLRIHSELNQAIRLIKDVMPMQQSLFNTPAALDVKLSAMHQKAHDEMNRQIERPWWYGLPANGWKDGHPGWPFDGSK